MRRFIYVLFICFTLSSCKTNLVYFNVQQPAPVTLSNKVQVVGILNRANLDPAQSNINEVQLALGANTKAIVQEGSMQAVEGLKNALMEQHRFKEVKLIPQTNLYTSTLGKFPPLLSWNMLHDLCKREGVDALIVLEVFDTRIKVQTPALPPASATPGAIINDVLNAQVPITTEVKTGWHVYDPTNNLLKDEYILQDAFTFTAGALATPQAIAAVMGRKDKIYQTANQQGRAYVSRLIPYWQKVTRDYYVKGTASFKTAMRKARTGHWNEAGELWKRETNNRNRKIAGRACYNMAILSEINGNLEEAIQWASKAYEDYNNRLALDYVHVLQNRLANERLLESGHSHSN